MTLILSGSTSTSLWNVCVWSTPAAVQNTDEMFAYTSCIGRCGSNCCFLKRLDCFSITVWLVVFLLSYSVTAKWLCVRRWTDCETEPERGNLSSSALLMPSYPHHHSDFKQRSKVNNSQDSERQFVFIDMALSLLFLNIYMFKCSVLPDCMAFNTSGLLFLWLGR